MGAWSILVVLGFFVGIIALVIFFSGYFGPEHRLLKHD
jgi:hypothetical protein